MAEATRRSGRARKQNPRYLGDPTEDHNDLEDIGSSDGDTSEFEQDNDEENQDLDADEDLDEDANEDESSMTSENEADTTEVQETYGSKKSTTVPKIVSFSTPPIQNGTSGKTSSKREKRLAKSQPDAPRSRGNVFNHALRNRNTAIHEIGGNDDFFVDFLKREHTKYIDTPTMPFREYSGIGRSGLAYPEVYSESIRVAERQKFLHWYEENQGRQTMAEVQATRPCSAEEIARYIDADLPPQDILLGPYEGQQRFTLDCLDSISVPYAWQTAISATTNKNDFDTDATSRPAWIVNTGSRILSMDWAPNHNGDLQYLAVSVGKNSPTSTRATALGSVDSYEASVQIWAFSSTSSGDKKLVDMNTKPKLVHVICAKWGSVRRLSWCPAAVSTAKDTSSIGVLGTVSTDGFVRIWDVCVGKDVYMLYEAAAFESKPPDTIFTCLTWLSASQLATGCGNGYVAIWDIGECLVARNSSTTSLSPVIPVWYHALHTTYVTSIIAHQPYPCQYISTNAVDGRVCLVSIYNPHRDATHGSRARQLVPPLCVSPHTLGFFENDDADGVRARSVRNLPFSRSVAKASSQVTCIDAGKAHSCLLFGGSDGSVVITNPLHRILLRRLSNNKIAGWQQIWFRHEFVPSTRLQPTDYASSLQVDSVPHSHIHPRKGYTRFLESFNMDKIPLSRGIPSNKDSNVGETETGQEAPLPAESQAQDAADELGQSSAGNDEIQISIYEEEQAVTCLSWNATIPAGGWAAAGMANGLLRIEDLAI